MHDWEVYFLAEPFGQPRADMMAGMIAAANANLWRGEGQAPIEPCEMIGEEKPEPTEQEMRAGITEFLVSMR